MIIYNSFFLSNFNYCPVVWHFCGKNSTGLGWGRGENTFPMCIYLYCIIMSFNAWLWYWFFLLVFLHACDIFVAQSYSIFLACVCSYYAWPVIYVYVFVNFYILYVCRNTSSSELMLYVYIYPTKNKASCILYLVFVPNQWKINAYHNKISRFEKVCTNWPKLGWTDSKSGTNWLVRIWVRTNWLDTVYPQQGI